MKKGNRNRHKGSAYEREAVAKLEELGIAATKQPLSGALANAEWKGDIKLLDSGVVVECKYNAKGFATATLEKLKDDAEILMMREPRKDWMLYMSLETLGKLLAKKEGD